jgi:hypothetical protein
MAKKTSRRKWPDRVVAFIDEPHGMFCVCDPQELLMGKGYLDELQAVMRARGYRATKGREWPRPAHYFERVKKTRKKPPAPQ